jgi:hypothetical protein
MGTKVNTVGCVDRRFAGELAFARRLHLYITRELARNAESQFELARVRRMKVALIDHVTAFGRINVPVDPLPAMPTQTFVSINWA